MARRGRTAENNARSGRSRALHACAAKPRSFPPPRGRCAPRKSGRASPEALPVRFRRLAGRGIAPAARRRAGCCTPVRSSVDGAPPTLAAGQSEAALGVKGIWPQAILIENPAHRAGSAKRTQAGVAGRSARERPSRVARSGRSPGRPPKPLAPFFGDFLWRKESHSPSVDYRQTAPLTERQI